MFVRILELVGVEKISSPPAVLVEIPRISLGVAIVVRFLPDPKSLEAVLTRLLSFFTGWGVMALISWVSSASANGAND